MSAENAETAEPRTVVVDLGKKKRKDVKKLRKGEGRLMERIGELVEQMKAEGQLTAGAETVVVVVERKKKNTMRFPGLR